MTLEKAGLPRDDEQQIVPENITPQNILGEIGIQFSRTLDALHDPSLDVNQQGMLDRRIGHLFNAENIVTKYISDPGSPEITGLKKLYVGQVLANCLIEGDPGLHSELRGQIAGALGRVSMYSSGSSPSIT